MIKNNPKIKDNITIIDKINAIESIVSSYFTKDKDNGNITKYTPYYYEIAEVYAIVENFLDGIEIEDEDTKDTFMKDEDVFNLIKKFYYNIEETDGAKKENEENFEYISIMNFVKHNVEEIVEFKKQQLVHRDEELRQKLALGSESLEKISYFFEVIGDTLYNLSKLDLQLLKPENAEFLKNVLLKLKDSNMTEESIANIIKGAVGFDLDKAAQDIINDKNKQIVELQKYKELYEARNVSADK